ncbi:MAG: DUF438 domain-containing protein [Candidatus Zixiibacteriota bacterium]
MSELLDNTTARRNVLKHLILQLHQGQAPEQVRPQLVRLLGRVPYDEVVAVEQELISDGMPASEILSLCDLHSAAMKGAIDTSGAKSVPPGHPVHTFKMENQALAGELALTDKLFSEIAGLPEQADATEPMGQLRVRFSRLSDIDKHYRRKENLLFPFLEKKGITGPPTVMWGKDDEVRELLKGAIEALAGAPSFAAGEAQGVIELVLKPTTEAIKEMIFKEEEILLPMCLDKLNDAEWYAIYVQSPEIGYCIYDPSATWSPGGVPEVQREPVDEAGVRFDTGSLTPTELEVILNTIPFDLTFVGADDTVKYFTQGRERIFARNRAIIGRQVQMCHPPNSVHVVEQIIADFKAGRQDRAPFWITLNGKFIHIEYFAVRDREGKYLGTLEVSQDLTEKRSLTGQQRLLSYVKEESL